MIVCICHELSEEDIRRMQRYNVQLPQLKCGKCREYLERMGVL